MYSPVVCVCVCEREREKERDREGLEHRSEVTHTSTQSVASQLQQHILIIYSLCSLIY